MKRATTFYLVVCIVLENKFSYSWQINTHHDSKETLEEKLKSFINDKPEPKFCGTCIPWKNEKKSFEFCKLSSAQKKYACYEILESDSYENVVKVSREYSKGGKCKHQKFDFRVAQGSHEPEKTRVLDMYECPPTNEVDKPYFLTDGGKVEADEGESEPSLYLFQRSGVHPLDSILVEAQITDIPIQAIKRVKEPKRPKLKRTSHRTHNP